MAQRIFDHGLQIEKAAKSSSHVTGHGSSSIRIHQVNVCARDSKCFSSSSICQQQCHRHLTDGLASSPSIIVTGIDFPMFALYITKAILLLSYVCTSSPNHFFLLLIIHTFPLLKKRACLQKMDLNLSCTFDIYFFLNCRIFCHCRGRLVRH